MGTIPAFLMRHTMIVEPYLGNGAHGPIYGPPVTVMCFVEDKRRLIRGLDGSEVVSESTSYCPLGTDAPAESRVQVNGRVTTVISAGRRDGGGLPTPDHLEVLLL
jgi:hypothetical protein